MMMVMMMLGVSGDYRRVSRNDSVSWSASLQDELVWEVQQAGRSHLGSVIDLW